MKTPDKTRKNAIIIAVLFGIFTWLYTYKYDAWKFWASFVLSIITFGIFGIVAWIWAVIDSCNKDDKVLANYYSK